ncbi:MAG: malate permease [Candidatus Atribacteria bacterium]|nr:malate permease [Candidatus Atribacteria bacterium]
MYQVLAVMFILIALGMFLRGAKIFPPETAPLLNRFVLYLTFPCLIFRSLQPAHLSSELWKIPPLAYALISLVFLASYFLSSRLLHLKDETSVSLAMGAAFGNTAFLGYPFISALLGEKGLPPAIFFDQMGNFLSTYTVGVLFCVYAQAKRLSARSLLEIIKLPPFLAFLLAIITNGLAIPSFLWETINRLADATVPLTMVAIGMSLSASHLFRNWKLLLSTSLIKLVALPLLFLLCTKFVSFNPLYQKVMIIQAATPTLMTSYTLSSIYNLDSEFSSSVIFFTTFLSLLTLPLWGSFLHL